MLPGITHWQHPGFFGYFPCNATGPAILGELLSAGLGLTGLRAMTPPAFADAEHPTPSELRRRALWSNWRGIADLAPGGPARPGRCWSP